MTRTRSERRLPIKLSLVGEREDTAIQGELYVSFELGDKSWKVTASDGHCGPSRYNVEAGDTAAVAHCIGKAREGCKLEPQAKVHSCYEAGRDGWWLHRWLIEQGVDSIVVDSSSIEVNLASGNSSDTNQNSYREIHPHRISS